MAQAFTHSFIFNNDTKTAKYFFEKLRLIDPQGAFMNNLVLFLLVQTWPVPSFTFGGVTCDACFRNVLILYGQGAGRM